MKWILLGLLIFAFACTKEHETLFSAEDRCWQYKMENYTEDLRNPYDDCIVMNKEILEDRTECLGICKDDCLRKDMIFQQAWGDFSGCHCICNEKIKKKS